MVLQSVMIFGKNQLICMPLFIIYIAIAQYVSVKNEQFSLLRLLYCLFLILFSSKTCILMKGRYSFYLYHMEVEMLSQKIQAFIKERLYVVSDDCIEAHLLTEGRSGANVYRTNVKSRRERLTGNYIVKICDIPAKEEEKEAYKADALHKSAPDFSKHLVKVEAEAEIDGKTVIIYNQANNSVMDMVAFSELSGDMLAKYVKQVSFDILSLMNKHRNVERAEGDFFHCLLVKQLGKCGRFESRIKDLLENPKAESVALNGEVFPNPLCFVKNAEKLKQCLSGQFFSRE